jgi:hypothetical protein
MSKGKQAEKPFASLLAGATAGGIESFVTFPLESLKTQLQFGSLNGGKVCIGLDLGLDSASYCDRVPFQQPHISERSSTVRSGCQADTPFLTQTLSAHIGYH